MGDDPEDRQCRPWWRCALRGWCVRHGAKAWSPRPVRRRAGAGHYGHPASLAVGAVAAGQAACARRPAGLRKEAARRLRRWRRQGAEGAGRGAAHQRQHQRVLRQVDTELPTFPCSSTSGPTWSGGTWPHCHHSSRLPTSSALWLVFFLALGEALQMGKLAGLPGGAWDCAWQTSWGVSTRLLGTLVMGHGDDNGLRLPPNLTHSSGRPPRARRGRRRRAAAVARGCGRLDANLDSGLVRAWRRAVGGSGVRRLLRYPWARWPRPVSPASPGTRFAKTR